MTNIQCHTDLGCVYTHTFHTYTQCIYPVSKIQFIAVMNNFAYKKSLIEDGSKGLHQ